MRALASLVMKGRIDQQLVDATLLHRQQRIGQADRASPALVRQRNHLLQDIRLLLFLGQLRDLVCALPCFCRRCIHVQIDLADDFVGEGSRHLSSHFGQVFVRT